MDRFERVKLLAVILDKMIVLAKVKDNADLTKKVITNDWGGGMSGDIQGQSLELTYREGEEFFPADFQESHWRDEVGDGGSLIQINRQEEHVGTREEQEKGKFTL